MKTSMAIMTLGLILVSAPLQCRSADLLDNWTWRNPLPTGNILASVAYGNGLHGAVGNAGTIFTSPDGSNWIRRISGTSTDLHEVVFGGGLFVAVGGYPSEGAVILTSPDGIAWSSRPAPTAVGLYSVA